jgi:hypothetical protein
MARCVPLAHPIREGVRQEHAVEQRLDHAAERVVDDAVAERRGADLALGRLPHDEVPVAPGAVRLGDQLLLEPEQVALEIELEGGDVRAGALAPSSLAERFVEIFERRDVGPEIRVAFHAGRPTPEFRTQKSELKSSKTPSRNGTR